MLKPGALGRRVAQRPTLFRHSQTSPGKKKRQPKSITFRSPCHCDLFLPFETDSGSLSGNFRQNQAVSGRIRHFQAESGNFKQDEALFRHFQAFLNQAKSGSPLIWEIIGQGSSGVPRSTNCCPFLGRVFLGAFHQTKAQANQNQTANNGIILPTTRQIC